MARRTDPIHGAVFVAALLSLPPGSARAQVLVSGAAGASVQGAGESDVPYLGPPFSGTAVSLLGAVDVVVLPIVSVGGEASLAGDISGTQTQRASGGVNNFVSDHHDHVFSGTVKVGTPFDRRARVSAVGGLGVAQRHTSRTGTTSIGFPTAVTSPFETTLIDYVLAATVGADVVVALTGRVAILAAGRIHWLKDDDREPDGVVKRGVSSTILRGGAGVLVRF